VDGVHQVLWFHAEIAVQVDGIVDVLVGVVDWLNLIPPMNWLIFGVLE
jgi:hypothetical protein